MVDLPAARGLHEGDYELESRPFRSSLYSFERQGMRIRRLTDYGIVLLVHMGAEPRRVFRASELSARTNLPQPTVGKLLRALTRKGLLASHRGARGGYRLAVSPDQVSIAQLIATLEGPLALTLCVPEAGGRTTCRHQSHCPAQSPWQRIQRAVLLALEDVSLGDMIGTGKGMLPAMQPAENQDTGAYSRA